MKIDITSYLNCLEGQLKAAPRYPIGVERKWAKEFPNKAGVYIIRYKDIIVYAGETGSLRGRMKDICNTKNHTLRRTIGAEQFATHPAYTKATAKLSFCPEIESMLNTYLARNLTMSYLEVDLGRKELEEQLLFSGEVRYNKKSKRISS